MKRLSALDALFLYMEGPETPMHVAGVTVCKPETPSDDLFARFRAHTAARLDLLPSYRRRLEWTPLGLDHPVWVDDDKLDLDYHIRRAALPKPGGMAELQGAGGRAARRPARPDAPAVGNTSSSRGSRTAPSRSTSRCTIARWTASEPWRRSASCSTSRPRPSTKSCAARSFRPTRSRPTGSN